MTRGPVRFSRRALFAVLFASIAGSASCGLFTEPTSSTDARISVTPHAPISALAPGRYDLGLGDRRDGFLFVPAAAATATAKIPLIVLFHGAGQSAAEFEFILPLAEQRGFAVLAPDSRALTWDIQGGFGPDVKFVTRALNSAFDHVNIDLARLAIGGFSDGASYAITVGLTNGDLFRRVVAFSPGYYIALEPRGKPFIFISHGLDDDVLPIESSGAVVEQQLHDDGYTIQFMTFRGGHTIPEDVARSGINWWLLGL